MNIIKEIFKIPIYGLGFLYNIFTIWRNDIVLAIAIVFTIIIILITIFFCVLVCNKIWERISVCTVAIIVIKFVFTIASVIG